MSSSSNSNNGVQVEADSDIVIEAVDLIVAMVNNDGYSALKALNKVSRMLDLEADYSVGIGPAPELEVIAAEVERIYGAEALSYGYSMQEEEMTPWQQAISDELEAMDYEYDEC
jgi:predicted SpoU family rRNA methylase